MNIAWLRISSDTAPDMIYINDIQHRYTAPIYSNDRQHRYTATIYSNDIQQVQNGMIFNLLKHLIVMYLLIVIAMS